jgi:hypothetical protein
VDSGRDADGSANDRKEATMDPLLVGLVIVDEMNDRRQMRQLAAGWMGWEWQRGRRLRARTARLLLTVAAWIAPAIPPAQAADSIALEPSLK